jgi:tripartite-type tricarboxylate transporter receptor subunit TctC
MQLSKYISPVIAIFLAIFSQSGLADDYPNRPVKVVVPFAAGGGADIVARAIFQKVSAQMGQPFIIENKGSAGGILGSDSVAKAAPDGYTLLLGQTGPNAINPALFAKIPYDPVKDFAPIIQLTSYPYVLAVNLNLPEKNLAELVAYAKAHPGAITFSTAGNGSSAQLAAELFMKASKIQMTHVPYKGAGPALMDAVSGVVSMTFGDAGSSTPMVLDNRIRAVAVTSKNRSLLLPGVPTIAESGYPGFEAVAWHGVLAPAKTPPEIIKKLNQEIAKALKDPEIRNRFSRDGLEIVGGSPEDFSNYIKAEVGKWGKVVRESNIKLD